MGKGIASITIRRQRGKLTVQGIGRAARGAKYIKAELPLDAPKMNDKTFKSDMSAAVEKLYS